MLPCFQGSFHCGSIWRNCPSRHKGINQASSQYIYWLQHCKYLLSRYVKGQCTNAEQQFFCNTFVYILLRVDKLALGCSSVSFIYFGATSDVRSINQACRNIRRKPIAFESDAGICHDVCSLLVVCYYYTKKHVLCSIQSW